ncbi:MAG TPA: phosphoglycerate kinase [Chloroflexota bacterium]|nr:phosphoglycerate kinase [Chloroflexota bacterium]
MNKKTVGDLDVAGKTALVRVDFNVPLDKDRKVTDATRIEASLPTIRYLLDGGAKLILMSHLGRPDGQVVDKLRMAPVARELERLLGRPVKAAKDCVGPEVEAMARGLHLGEVLLLENLRFHPEEEANDPSFAKQLASLGDLYVNDAFGTAHRAHASTAGVTAYLPAVAGFLMRKELDALGGILEAPERPVAAIIGGAKVSSKIKVLENLLEKVEVLLIGGGMANTFLKAKGYDVGASLLEEDKVGVALELMKQASDKGVQLGLPTDVVAARKFEADAESKIVPADQVPEGWTIMDIGPLTIEEYRHLLLPAKTVFWNGPMGVFEMPRFAAGTKAIADVLSKLEATTVVGGGDSVAAVEQMGYADRMSHISTGGGASLEMIEGRTLPGVAALQDK